jgi:hypothetical protein
MTSQTLPEPAATAAPTGEAPPLRVTIRPGVTFPDWSAVSSANTKAALNAIFEAFGAARCWDSYSAEDDRVRRAVFEGYASDGRAPGTGALAEATGLEPARVRELLTGLKSRDLVVLDESGSEVTGAYPLTNRETGHRVGLPGQSVNAMCAIDALGTGGMFGEDSTVESACRNCGAGISIRTEGRGRTLAEASPATALVWSGIEYEDGCAATSLCTVIAFFCSDQCLESWRAAEHPDTEGYRLSMDEALQAGLAIFGPMLTPATE